MLNLVLNIDDGKHPPKCFKADDFNGIGIGRGSNNQQKSFRRAGEVFISYDFPRDADYTIRVHAWGTPLADETVRMTLKLDEWCVSFDLDADPKQPACHYKLHVPAGRYKIAAAFVNPFEDVYENEPKKTRYRTMQVDWLEVEGPQLTGSKSLPEPYTRIMIADPDHVGRAEAARQIIKHFADRAFRRPIDDDELDRLMQLYSAADHDDVPFPRAVQPALEAVLVNPRFLFRVELDSVPNNPQAQHPIDDWELASRLSYFLWSSMPDDELFDLARRGQLRDQLQPQIERMLRDPKSQALVENFAGQWLQSRRLDIMSPDPKQYPAWNDDLRRAMRQEGLSLFAYIMANDRSLLEFIDAPYTFVNEDLADLYGIPDVHGSNFRKVDLPAGSPRGGVITMASTLTTTSNPDRTSPVKRGKWILENILGTPPPPPLPDVPQLVTRDNGRLIGTVRQQMEQHRKDPLRRVPRAHGSAGLRPGKLRCHWRLARSRRGRGRPRQCSNVPRRNENCRKQIGSTPRQSSRSRHSTYPASEGVCIETSGCACGPSSPAPSMPDRPVAKGCPFRGAGDDADMDEQ